MNFMNGDSFSEIDKYLEDLEELNRKEKLFKDFKDCEIKESKLTINPEYQNIPKFSCGAKIKFNKNNLEKDCLEYLQARKISVNDLGIILNTKYISGNLEYYVKFAYGNVYLLENEIELFKEKQKDHQHPLTGIFK